MGGKFITLYQNLYTIGEYYIYIYIYIYIHTHTHCSCCVISLQLSGGEKNLYPKESLHCTYIDFLSAKQSEMHK